MTNSIFEALFYGKTIPWAHRASHSPERAKLERKIEVEKRYFIEKMSLDDVQRFQTLEGLYSQASSNEEVNIFSHGFTLGALIMMEVMSGREDVVNE